MSKIGVFSSIKDADNILEFMEHYYNLGFDFIYILDDLSKKPIKSIIGEKFVNKYKVFEYNNYPELKNLVNNKAKSIYFDNHAAVYFSKYTKFFKKYILKDLKKYMSYCLYVDDDEYLHLNNFKNIKEVIDYYSPFDQLKINWVLYSNLTNEKIVTNKLKDLNFIPSKIYDHVKCLIKLSSFTSTTIIPNSHFVYINGITKNILNEVTEASHLEKSVCDYNYKDVNLYIAHYHIQGIYNFLKRKFCRQTSNTAVLCGGNEKNIYDFIEYTTNNIDSIVQFIASDQDSTHLNYKAKYLCIRTYLYQDAPKRW